jgi:hypothetical protein
MVSTPKFGHYTWRLAREAGLSFLKPLPLRTHRQVGVLWCVVGLWVGLIPTGYVFYKSKEDSRLLATLPNEDYAELLFIDRELSLGSSLSRRSHWLEWLNDRSGSSIAFDNHDDFLKLLLLERLAAEKERHENPSISIKEGALDMTIRVGNFDTDTNVFLKEAQKVEVLDRGTVAPPLAPCQVNCRVPGAPKSELVARIGGQEWFVVERSFTASREGRLLFALNDRETLQTRRDLEVLIFP